MSALEAASTGNCSTQFPPRGAEAEVLESTKPSLPRFLPPRANMPDLPSYPMLPRSTGEP